MHHRFFRITSGLVLATFTTSSLAVSFTAIPDLAGGVSSNSRAFSMTPDAKAVAGFGISSNGLEAYRWTECGTTGLGDLPGGSFGSIGNAISSNGNKVVGYSASANGNQEAFEWTNAGGIVGIGDLAGGAFLSRALGISADGLISVGFGTNSASGIEAFSYNGSSFTPLGHLAGGGNDSRAFASSSDGSVIVGSSDATAGVEAFRYASGVMTSIGDLAGGATSSTATDVSADGNTVVGVGTSANGSEAFIWQNNTMTSLGDLDGGTVSSSSSAVSSTGSTVVGKGTTVSGDEAFVWTQAAGMKNLKTLLLNQGVNVSGWTLSEATDVSQTGKQIVGFGTNPDGETQSFLADLSGTSAYTKLQGDFNGDGNTDVLWRNKCTGQNHIYLMNGNQILQQAQLDVVNDKSYLIAAIGDFNGDGKDDILWRNRISGTNWLYLMNGLSTLNSYALNNVVTEWNVAGAGDVNGDGTDDIVWRNTKTGMNWLYIMQNGQISNASRLLNVVNDQNWVIAGVADLNADGTEDIFWRNAVSGQNYVYIMANGAINNSLSKAVNTVTDSNWIIAGINDINNDGAADILWRNYSTGQNWVYFMNGGNIASQKGINVVSDLSWDIVGNGDYNNDGSADILWKNLATGVIWMYTLGASGSIANSQSVSSVTSLWKVNGLQ